MEYLTETTEELVITKTVNAPKELVFKVWTQPEHLAHWWGPKGFVLKVSKLELRPGGMFLYSMSPPGGQEMWGRFLYREVKPHDRMVFENSFTDENGNPIRNPWSPTWPLEVRNELTLEESNGKTTITLKVGPINATEEERNTFVAGIAGMQQGFAGTFDQLDAYLNEI